jgi:hypothetical protein
VLGFGVPRYLTCPLLEGWFALVGSDRGSCRWVVDSCLSFGPGLSPPRPLLVPASPLPMDKSHRAGPGYRRGSSSSPLARYLVVKQLKGKYSIHQSIIQTNNSS